MQVLAQRKKLAMELAGINRLELRGSVTLTLTPRLILTLYCFGKIGCKIQETKIQVRPGVRVLIFLPHAHVTPDEAIDCIEMVT